MSRPPESEALRKVLSLVPAHTAVERLDRVWVFPPKEFGKRESGLVVLALLPIDPAAPDQRKVCTLRYETRRPGDQPIVCVTEEGLAPAARIPRILAGVVARLGDTDEPTEFVIGGSAEAWDRLLGLPVGSVDRAERE